MDCKLAINSKDHFIVLIDRFKSQFYNFIMQFNLKLNNIFKLSFKFKQFYTY